MIAPYATESDPAVYESRPPHAKAPWEKEGKAKPRGRMAQSGEQRVQHAPYATSVDLPGGVSSPTRSGSSSLARMVPPWEREEKSKYAVLPSKMKTAAPWEREDGRTRSKPGKGSDNTWACLAPYATDQLPSVRLVSSPKKPAASRGQVSHVLNQG
ncbi:hypothetical protein CBR_g26329 [Chara braunii]|uniref:Uncharacterized protein n=1 Tax=Chara braunii TaxID=69332 RepID=A0A388L7L8_CHABU|nr:hypothetical protein CBR_g26329 [Chara braunii]|eukprot:GBG78299.1 hypothetical protein CBR_g26329 [Chara braunii]